MCLSSVDSLSPTSVKGGIGVLRVPLWETEVDHEFPVAPTSPYKEGRSTWTWSWGPEIGSGFKCRPATFCVI